MKTWERFSLFCNAERNGRYRASLPVVEVDRREEWVRKYLVTYMNRVYGVHWTEMAQELNSRIIRSVAAEHLSVSGEDFYK